MLYLGLFCIFVGCYAGSFQKLDYMNAYETGKFLAKSFENVKFDEKDYSTCVSKISTKIEEDLDKAEIQFRENIFETIGNDRKFVKMCNIYENYRTEIQQCKNAISGVINTLKLVCDIKINSIAKNTECLHDMETNLKTQCRNFCAAEINDKNNLENFEKNSHEEIQCMFAECHANCINFQIRECTDEEPIKQLYNELSGSQMLMGLEKILNFGAQEIFAIKNIKFPEKCQVIIEKSFEIIRRVKEELGSKIGVEFEKEAKKIF